MDIRRKNTVETRTYQLIKTGCQNFKPTELPKCELNARNIQYCGGTSTYARYRTNQHHVPITTGTVTDSGSV